MDPPCQLFAIGQRADKKVTVKLQRADGSATQEERKHSFEPAHSAELSNCTFNNVGRDQRNYYSNCVVNNHVYSRETLVCKCVVLGGCQATAIVSAMTLVTTNVSVAAPYWGLLDCNAEDLISLTVKTTSVRYSFFSNRYPTPYRNSK
jgi:hypothetical protein